MNDAGSRETQLGQQMSRLDGAIKSATDSIGQLRGRLQPILRPEPSCAIKLGENPQEELVPFANEIRSKAEQVSQLNTQIIDIMSNLEM